MAACGPPPIATVAGADRREAAIKPLCFVLMPFGERPDPAAGLIDFDAVYTELIVPAIEAAQMEPVRADSGGSAPERMLERMVLCDYAVADLTTENAGVFYGLGVRHAIRPQSTVLVFAGDRRLPIDVASFRSVPYSLVAGRPSDSENDAMAIRAALDAARTDSTDSQVYELVDDLASSNISRLKTDVFRERVDYGKEMKRRLATARDDGPDAVAAVAADLASFEDAEFAVLIDLLLSYRAVRSWDEMIALARAMPLPLAHSVMVREQLALALNRAGRSDEAERVVLELIEERGPSGETYAILGRVYKDRWQAAEGEPEAHELLSKAIDAYLSGFEADWRDAYPGVNAVTLMELADPPDPRRHQLVPVVRYSSERRVASGRSDYWDHAALLELAVVASDPEAARRHAGDALAEVREVWEPETTARNLGLIRRARAARGEPVDWLDEIISDLTTKVSNLSD